VKEGDDPFVTLADEATVQFSLSTAPGFLVNLVPACELSSCLDIVKDLILPLSVRHIPDWVPGAGFKKTAMEWRHTLAQMAEGPHQFVKQQMVHCHIFSCCEFLIPFLVFGNRRVIVYFQTISDG